MGGFFSEYLLGKGWTAPCISMLNTVVDPRAKGSAMAMFQIIVTLCASISPIVIGPIVQSSNLNPEIEE